MPHANIQEREGYNCDKQKQIILNKKQQSPTNTQDIADVDWYVCEYD